MAPTPLTGEAAKAWASGFSAARMEPQSCAECRRLRESLTRIGNRLAELALDYAAYSDAEDRLNELSRAALAAAKEQA